MPEKPRLILPPMFKGMRFDYQCSRCGQPFVLPEDQTPKQGMAEVWAAFKEHAQEEHPEDGESTQASDGDASEETQQNTRSLEASYRPQTARGTTPPG